MTSDQFKLVRVASTVALGGFLVGFDATVISGAVPFIRDYFALGGPSGTLKLGWAVSCLGWGAMGGKPRSWKLERPVWAQKRSADDSGAVSGFLAHGGIVHLVSAVCRGADLRGTGRRGRHSH